MFCNKCGTEVEASARFCNKCGNQLNNMGSIVFFRENHYVGCLLPIKVFLDGNLVASVENGKEVKVETTIGKHKVMFDVWSGNGQDEIELTNEHPNVKVTFKLGMGAFTSKPKIINITNI